MSGLYIPGLSMPRKTGIVSIVLSGDGSALLCEDGAYSEIKVIPVPDHGDLIDRDAARGSIKPRSPEDERAACTFATVKKLMHTMLDRAPTIIPADEEG